MSSCVQQDWRDERIAELEGELGARDARIAELEQQVASLSERLGQAHAAGRVQ
jgi:hypothetical protein